MPPSPVNVALITGHPSHGLRVFRFLEVYRPIVYIITDGSGSSGKSGHSGAKEFVEKSGARTSPIFCCYTDDEFYTVIKSKDTKALRELVDLIVKDLASNDIDTIVGDAAEGFNPTHDLCRYVINAVVDIYRQQSKNPVGNFDFLLEGPPDTCPSESSADAIRLELTEADLVRKIAAAKRFPAIGLDVDHAIKHYGEARFRIECLRPVKDHDRFRTWGEDQPHYETYGAQKVRDGVYSDLISFGEHLLPLAQYLNGYAAP